VPQLPASLIEPLWAEFAALIGSDRPEFDPAPWAVTAAEYPDRVVFDDDFRLPQSTPRCVSRDGINKPHAAT
jgi:hypothetical protein